MDAFGVSVRQHTHTADTSAVVPPFAITARGGGAGGAGGGGISRPSARSQKQSHPIVNIGEVGASSSNLINARSNGGSVVLARISLITVALLFGMLNICLRLVYAFPDPPAPPVVGLLRGVFAALCFAPSILRLTLLSCSTRSSTFIAKGRTGTQGTTGLFQAAFWLGAWNVLAQGLLTVGLSLTSSSVRCSFLAQSSVVITPFISMMGGQRVKSSVWAGAFLAMIGLFALATADGSNSGGQVGIDHTNGASDLLVLGCAVCWSIYLHQFGVVADLYDNVALQAATCGMRAIMYIVWFLAAALIRQSKEGTEWKGVQTMWLGWRDVRVWGLLLFSAVGSGALAGVLQQRGQAVLSAAESNIILSSEPIFACLFAWILLGEFMSPRENLGGVFIFCAAIIASGAFEGILLTSHRRKAAEDASPPAR